MTKTSARRGNPTKRLARHSQDEKRRIGWFLAMAAPLALFPVWDSIPSGSPMLGSFMGLVLIQMLVCTSLTDLTRRKIYNWSSYSAILWALAFNAFCDFMSSSENYVDRWQGAIGIKASLFGLVACFGVMLIPYSLARGGAGDVKLAAAVGAILGFEQGIWAIAASYIIAGITIAVTSLLQQRHAGMVSALARRVLSRCAPALVLSPTASQHAILRRPIPLAGFFAIGTLCVLIEMSH